MAIQIWIGEGIDPTIKESQETSCEKFATAEQDRSRPFHLLCQNQIKQRRVLQRDGGHWQVGRQRQGHGDREKMDESKATSKVHLDSLWNSPPQNHE